VAKTITSWFIAVAVLFGDYRAGCCRTGSDSAGRLGVDFRRGGPLHWPSSSVWAIGTLECINLLMTGISRLMFGLAAQKLATRLAA